MADRPPLNPGETRVLTTTIGGLEHAIVLGRRIMLGRLVSCDCGWVDRFRYGQRAQLRAAERHLANWRQFEEVTARG